MGWSTRELANLANTSLRTVRHYHDVGLLAQPNRTSNGYKQYGMPHLIRVLKIKHLSELGFSLLQIASLDDTDDHSRQTVRNLDAELGASIERLSCARVELALVLGHPAPIEKSPNIADATIDSALTEADRLIVVVMTRLLGPSAFATSGEPTGTPGAIPDTSTFHNLPSDTDERSRCELAEHLASRIRLRDRSDDRDFLAGGEAFDLELQDLYNPAQVDVIRRIRDRLTSHRPTST
ncbi:MAG: MerR family transcriptional regulator [Rhodococcus sp. (in: high G+C Gram-positive bacteria)]